MSNKLEYLRKRANLSFRELESKTGITYSHLSKLERGDKPLTQKTITELCSFYGVSSDYLTGKSLSERLDRFVSDLEKDYSRISVYANGDVSISEDYADLSTEEILKLKLIFYILKLEKENLKKTLLEVFKIYNEQYQKQLAQELLDM